LFWLAAWHAVLWGDYDLVHLHNAEASFVLPILRPVYKVVATHHAMAYLRAKWGPIARCLMRMLDWPFVRLSNAVTFVSAKDAEIFRNRYHCPVTHIPNGVGAEYAPDLEKSRPLLEAHHLAPKGYLIFVAGRIEPTKGAHLAIQAVNQLDQEIPLLIVGDDMHLPEYHRLLHELAGSRIRFQPLISDAATLFGLMIEARALVFPSLLESMSMVLLEAAWLGVPVVSSDLVENRQVLHGDAIYFNSGEVGALMSQLNWLLKNEAEATLIASRARRRVQVEFSWDNIAARYVEVYHHVTQVLA
jgi:glycosyltransferase involved in cell wall biosynthesis